MSAAWHPGQCLTVGFEGTEVPRALAEVIEAGRVGGIILFSRNIEGPAQLRALTKTLAGLAPPDAPLVISVDQEGGRVQRLREPWTRWPPMRAVGERDDPAKTRELGEALARELRAEGIDWNFAPCVDVDSNPDNPVIGDRSFGTTHERVSGHAIPLLEGMQAGGVAACVKHFPGHGDTDVDSHLDLPRIDHALERLRRVELRPFEAAARADVASIMTAHVMFPRLDPRRPATMSEEVLGILRAEIGYQGIVVTDDLEMGAVARHFSVRERVESPLRAGVDVLLVCKQADLRMEAIAILERLPDALVESAVTRVRAFKSRWIGQRSLVITDPHAMDGPPWIAHQKLASGFASTSGADGDA